MTNLNMNTSIGRYIEDKKGHTGEITYKNYLSEINLFLNFMNENLYNKGEFTERITVNNFDRFLKKFTVTMVNDYKFYLIDPQNGYEPSSVSKKITIMKNFIKFLFDNEYIDKDFSHAIKNVKVPEKKVISLDADEVELLLKNSSNLKGANALRDELIIKLILTCGFRSFEIRELEVGNIDFEKSKVTFRAKRDFEGETTDLPIDSRLLGKIRKYIDVNRKEGVGEHKNILFTTRLGGMLSTQSLIDLIKKRLIECGISEEKASVITTHKLRSSYITFLVRKGVNTLEVQKMARHKSASTTAKYVNVDDKRKVEITNTVFVDLF